MIKTSINYKTPENGGYKIQKYYRCVDKLVTVQAVITVKAKHLFYIRLKKVKII